MNSDMLSDKEFDKLTSRLSFFNTERNSLLTFSFTAVLAVLGIAIGTDNGSFSAWVCLIPFFLIIPFSARISYYRLSAAHIGSFLKVYAPNRMVFELGASTVPEGRCRFYKQIAWLVNHEMFLLGLATDFTFYYRYVNQTLSWGKWECLGLTVPLLCTLPVLLFSDTTFNYKKMVDDFATDWKAYKQNS